MGILDTGTKLFLGCFEFDTDSDEASDEYEDFSGSFQIVVQAASREEALDRCKAKLHQIAAESADPGFPGPSRVFLEAMIELSADDLQNGVLVNWRRSLGEGELEDALPDQKQHGTAHYPDTFAELVEPLPDLPVEDGFTSPPIWNGVEGFYTKWKLYWCTTPDHNEDWFAIARNKLEAEEFHIEAEGYGEDDDATAELVCVLPASEQNVDEPQWPSDSTLRACGAEFLPNVPQDNLNALRRQVGSGARVVRLRGRIYAEGDIVGNIAHRLDETKDS